MENRSRLPNQEPTAEGTRVCPSQDGATNWFSPSYNPGNRAVLHPGLREVLDLHQAAGRVGAGKGIRRRKSARRYKPETAAIAVRSRSADWQPAAGNCRKPASAPSWGGTLATSTGLVFFGDDSGTFSAADAATGKTLWSFPANANWHASPMTYQFDGQQYVAIAAGGDILAFGLIE